VYGGFVSVELKDATGETLWSYLATQSTGSENISKDLSKQIVKHLSEALASVGREAPSDPSPNAAEPAVSLKGAGATFPYPVYAKWFRNYSREHPNVEITYEPIGSGAGIRKLVAGEADFGASDSPEILRELASGKEDNYLLFPSVVGAVVPIVNLPGFPSDIAFTPEVLAGIYLGL
jgi:ABC-type phosphate transport system substrate-binding protein